MQTETKTESSTTAKALIERLFKAGAHFGFTKSRRHPTTLPYIFGNKQGTDIIDLEKTGELLQAAKTVMEEAGRTGKTVLFVGTKEEIVSVVQEYAQLIEMPYVVNRWIGGILTNFSEIKKRIARLHELVSQGESGELERKYTKKERVVIGRELEKLTFNFGGIQSLDRIPSLIVVADARHDSIAVDEARAINMPIIGIAGSDTDISTITYPIVANDALQSSVRLLLEELTAAYKTGNAEYAPAKREEMRRRDR